jgi:hypothetical protein
MPDAYKPIQDRIIELQAEKRLLQDELRNASPGEKPPLNAQIREVATAIEEQQEELNRCRTVNPAPIGPDIGLELADCLDPGLRRFLTR